MAGCGRDRRSERARRAVAAHRRGHRRHPHRRFRRLGLRAARAVLRGSGRLRRAVALVGRAPRPVLGRRRRMVRGAARRSRRRGADPPEHAGRRLVPRPTINYAEQALRHATDEPGADRASPRTTRPAGDLLGDLRGQVGAFAATLRRLGVQPGDRVAGYLPNVPEAVVAFLGAASIGAVWSSCAPDFGTRAVLDRFAQIEPTVLVAVDGYRFNGKEYDRRDVVAELRAALPTVRTTVAVPRLSTDAAGRRAGVGRRRRRQAGAASSSRCRSTIRCGSSTRRARPACRRGSCTATAGSCSSSTSSWRCTSTSGPATGSSGTPRPPGSCGTSRRRRCCWARRSSSTTAPRRTRRSTCSSRWPRAPAITYLGTSAGYLTACEKAGIRPGEAVRPRGAAGDRLYRLAAAGGGVPLGLRRGEGPTSCSARCPAAPTSPPASSAARRCCRSPPASCSGRCSASPPRPGTSRAGPSSASSASWWSPSRCRRCRSTSGTTRTAPATARPTSSPGPGSGGTATGWRSPSAAPA